MKLDFSFGHKKLIRAVYITAISSVKVDDNARNLRRRLKRTLDKFDDAAEYISLKQRELGEVLTLVDIQISSIENALLGLLITDEDAKTSVETTHAGLYEVQRFLLSKTEKGDKYVTKRPDGVV